MAKLCVMSYKNRFKKLPQQFTTRYYFCVKNTHAYIFEGKNHLAVVFRGTDDFYDILHDINILFTQTKIGTVHRGFYAAFQTIHPIIKHKIETCTKKIFFTGHSLGAAIATICAAHYINKSPILVTFGSPKIGRKDFVQYTQQIHHIRWTNKKDLICQVPPWLFHFGEKRKLNFGSIFTLKTNHKIQEYYSLIKTNFVPIIFYELETII